MTTIDSNLITIGILVLLILALPAWVGFVYCMTKTPKEIEVDCGVPKKWMNNPKWRRAWVLWNAACGIVFGALAILLIWAGLGSKLAQRLLGLF